VDERTLKFSMSSKVEEAAVPVPVKPMGVGREGAETGGGERETHIHYIEGALITLMESGDYDVVVHGCNCFCTMGAGVAKVLRRRFPQAYAADLKTEKGDRSKLGTFTVAKVQTMCSSPEKKMALRRFAIANAYIQYRYSSRRQQINYGALRHCMRHLNTAFKGSKIRFLMPKIGAGLAGGDWTKIAAIIENELKGRHVTVVVWNGK